MCAVLPSLLQPFPGLCAEPDTFGGHKDILTAHCHISLSPWHGLERFVKRQSGGLRQWKRRNPSSRWPGPTEGNT